jgi:hypothetical protein
MAVILNASSTSGLVMTSDLSGVFTLQQNGVSLPNGGVAPAFSAYPSASQSIATFTYVKLAFDTKQFDTNTNFSTTNYRFTPTVAGYYQVTGSYYLPASASGQQVINLYKNGSNFITASYPFSSTGAVQPILSYLMYLNGSTDYIELYAYQSSGGALSTLANRSDLNFFQACLVRGA